MGHMIGLHLPKFLSGTANALRYAGVQLILIVPILIIYNLFFISGYKKLFKGAPNMDSLIALGATASIIYGIFAMIRMTQGLNSGDLVLVDEYRHNLYFESAGMILTLVSFGKYLESLSKKKTTNAITKLIGLAPKTARVIKNNEEVVIDAKDVNVNDIVIVKKGDLVPVDGVVIDCRNEEHCAAWRDLVRELKPREIMMYTIDRETPAQNLQKVTVEEMTAIAEPLLKEGFKIQIKG